MTRSLPIAGRAAEKPIESLRSTSRTRLRASRRSGTPSSSRTTTRTARSRTSPTSSATRSSSRRPRRRRRPTSSLRRRPLHGRDGEDPEPGQDRRRPRHGGGLLARRRLPAAQRRGVEGAATPSTCVVSYINCSAEVKALSDVHLHLVERGEDRRADPGGQDRSSSRPTGTSAPTSTRRPAATMQLWQGTCIVHETFSERRLVELKAQHPRRAASSRTPSARADPPAWPTTSARRRASSTSRRRARRARVHRRDRAGDPPPDEEGGAGQDVHPRAARGRDCACNECPHMRQNTLEKVYLSLRDLEPRLEMDPALLRAARVPIERDARSSR